MRVRVPESLLVTLFTVSTASAGEIPTDPILRLEAEVHTAAINEAAVTGDGRLLTVSDDKTARLWNAQGGIPLTLRVPIGPGDEGALFAVAASPTKGSAVVAGRTGLTWDGTDTIYGLDLNTGRITGRVSGLPGTVHTLSYSKDGRYLAAGTGAGVLMVYDLERARVAAEDSAAGSVTASAFLIDGRLVTASLDGQVRLYDPSFRITARFSLPEGMRPWRIAVAPEATRIAVGAIDAPVVHILSTDGLKPVTRLSGDPKQRSIFSVVVWAGTRVLAAGTYGDVMAMRAAPSASWLGT
jgi:WD40 repeat protein